MAGTGFITPCKLESNQYFPQAPWLDVLSACAQTTRHIISFIPKEIQLNNELVIPYGKKWEWKSVRQKQAKRKHPILYILTKWHDILEVFVSLVYDKHSVSSYLSSLLLPLIPKKGEKTGLLWLCNIYWGLSWWPSSLLPGYLWLAMPATDWPRPPEGSKDALGEKKKDAKKRHIDGVLLPFLSASKSLLLSSLFWFMYSLIYLCICRRERQLGEALGTACRTFPLKGWTQHQKSPCLLNLNWSQWRWIHALNTHTKT